MLLILLFHLDAVIALEPPLTISLWHKSYHSYSGLYFRCTPSWPLPDGELQGMKCCSVLHNNTLTQRNLFYLCYIDLREVLAAHISHKIIPSIIKHKHRLRTLRLLQLFAFILRIDRHVNLLQPLLIKSYRGWALWYCSFAL